MKEQFTFFWNGPFSQWYPSMMTIDRVEYNCAEQYMMSEKAWIFNDMETYEKIMSTLDPRRQKLLGRQVNNFDEKIWKSHCYGIVQRGNEAKFQQNETLANLLLATEGTTLVEASPYDAIWGIGLSEDDPRALDRKTWLGQNLLGEILTNVRATLKR